jgi:methyltransferase
MVISRGIFLAILAALVAERIFELWLSNRNARLAFAGGGIELGRGQYRIIVAFHTLFIAACAAGAMRYAPGFPPALSIVALAGEAAAQALRYWSVATLGRSWNTRVIVVPDMEPVTSGALPLHPPSQLRCGRARDRLRAAYSRSRDYRGRLLRR